MMCSVTWYEILDWFMSVLMCYSDDSVDSVDHEGPAAAAATARPSTVTTSPPLQQPVVQAVVQAVVHDNSESLNFRVRAVILSTIRQRQKFTVVMQELRNSTCIDRAISNEFVDVVWR